MRATSRSAPRFKAGEPDGVSLRALSPAARVRGLTQPGSPDCWTVSSQPGRTHPACLPKSTGRIERNVHAGNTGRTAGTLGILLTGEGAGLDWMIRSASSVNRGRRASCSDCISGACFASRRHDSISAGGHFGKSRRRGYGAERKDCANGSFDDLGLSRLLHLNGRAGQFGLLVSTSLTRPDCLATSLRATPFHRQNSNGSCPFE